MCTRVLYVCGVCVLLHILLHPKSVKYVRRKIAAEYKKAHTSTEREREKLEWMSTLVCK